MEDRTISIRNDKGEEILCEILFTTHSAEFNKDYVVFVEKGTNNASAAIYVPTNDGNGQLLQITSEEEWSMLEEMLDDYVNNNQNGCSNDCQNCSGCPSDDETLED